MNIVGINRLEIIDHTPCKACNGMKMVRVEGEDAIVPCPHCEGRGILGRLPVDVSRSTEIELSLQDHNKTLKIFVK